jgi:hypothetical protein
MGICSGRSRFSKTPSIAVTVPKSVVANNIVLDNINNHYEFQKVLGSGHFGIVREARKKGAQTKITFAIKSISKANITDDLENIKREL